MHSSGPRSRALLTLAGALALVVLGAVISGKRRTPSACPYALRLFLQLPRPLMSRDRVLRMLAPAPGQRVLEVGPGVGYYSLDLAAALAPGGVLDLLDIQEPMLQTVMQRATERGVTSISPHLGDAQASPFPDGTFDTVLCVATLGEIPDPARALHEMHRVLKPTGRLASSPKSQPDPHMVTRSALADLADASGFTCLALREGSPFGYVARLEPRVASPPRLSPGHRPGVGSRLGRPSRTWTTLPG
ncbi:MAG: methyltransferase domain-containing protein [Thermomicrobiales bacterium]